MWLFLPEGFVSVVAHRKLSDSVLVRGRNAEHLTALFPLHEQLILPAADYRYRVTVTREELAGVIGEHIANMTYANFKDSIHDYAYHDVCVDVWRSMWAYGHRQ
jgi:hypothetical protein